MYSWILNVVLVSVTGYLIKILLPDGKNKQSVIFAISLLSIIATISPLTKISKQDFNFDLDYYNEIQVDQTFLQYSENCREKYYLTIANTKLKEYLTINQANFIFDDTVSGNPLKKIEISLLDIVIKNNNQHINIPLIIKELLSEQFSISKESVIINDIDAWKNKRQI